ncbi:MAG: AMP-binding protein [Lautropia sp.]
MAELNAGFARRIEMRARDARAEAFRQKRHGIWCRRTWGEVWRHAQAFASTLAESGIGAGESLALVSGSRVEAIEAIYGCQLAAVRPVLLSPNLAPGALATAVEEADCAAIVAEDQEQVDKVADVQSRLAGLRRVWVIDPKGVRGYRHIEVHAFADATRAVDAVRETVPAAPVDAVALYTAGVRAEPRLVSVAQATVLKLDGARDALGLAAGERVVSLFGLADPLGHFFSVAAPVLFGVVPCFGEDRLPTPAEMRQCAPTIVGAPVRVLDRMRRETAVRANRTGGVRRSLLGRWRAVDRPGWLLDAVVGRPIARSLGLGECRTIACGYERLGATTADFFGRLGVRTVGLYGLAEAAGPVGIFEQAREPVLTLFPGYSAEVHDTRRLGVRIDGLAVDTGDVVQTDGAHLSVVGRSAELLTLSDGSRIAPGWVESELMASPYVSQAVAVGGPAGGVTALIELDEAALRDWARVQGLAFTTLRSFSESSEVQWIVSQAVQAANRRLEPSARVVRTVLLPRTLDAGNGELTPALALRRAMVRNRYAHRLIGAAA